MPETNLKVFWRPWHPADYEERDGLTFVSGALVEQVLDEATDGLYEVDEVAELPAPVSKTRGGKEMTQAVLRLRLKLPGLPARYGYGSMNWSTGQDYGITYRGAYTNALANAAARLGCSRELHPAHTGAAWRRWLDLLTTPDELADALELLDAVCEYGRQTRDRKKRTAIERLERHARPWIEERQAKAQRMIDWLFRAVGAAGEDAEEADRWDERLARAVAEGVILPGSGIHHELQRLRAQVSVPQVPAEQEAADVRAQ